MGDLTTWSGENMKEDLWLSKEGNRQSWLGLSQWGSNGSHLFLINYKHYILLCLQMSTNSLAVQETQEIRVQSLGQEDPLEDGKATPPVFLPGESHGQKSQMGYSP